MVRIAMAVAIFLSYTLQFYVPVNIVEPFVRNHFETNQAKDLSGTILRIVLVTITCKYKYKKTIIFNCSLKSATLF